MTNIATTIPFHLALPVLDLGKTMRFYQDVLECQLGRSSYRWVDVNYFGHQITFHEDPSRVKTGSDQYNASSFPVFHFGVILGIKRWHEIQSNLKDHKQEFIIGPKTVFSGEAGEQQTFFIKDPSGYSLEFKAFATREMIFQK